MAILNNSNAISTAGGYDINNSLRFRQSASARLSRTPGTAGNRKTWTFSAWVKISTLTPAGAQQGLFSARSTSTDQMTVFYQDEKISFQSGGSKGSITTNAVLRDPSAWYHLVVVLDATNATAADRAIIYLNGTRQSVTTATSFTNADHGINATIAHNIGAEAGTNTLFFDGYMAEINFIDGSAKAVSDFGATDAATGVWQPKAYTGTYGTNGFYLKFSDIATTSGSNAGLGKDFSGNTNYWTTNNISVTSGTTYDAMTDSPTNTSATVANYAVMNPLAADSNATFSNANLTIASNAAGEGFIPATIDFDIASSTGYYFEVTVDSGTAYCTTGFIPVSKFPGKMWTGGTYPGQSTYNPGFEIRFSDGTILQNGGSSAYGSGATAGDTWGFAIKNGKVWARNSSGWFNSGNPVTEANPAVTGQTGQWLLGFAERAGAFGAGCTYNFGQRPFSYTPPSGYKALNTYNLPDSTIKKANSYFDATLYTGNGANRSITNAAGFRPDLVWGQARSFAYGSWLYDAVRGATKQIESFGTNAESTQSTMVTAFNSDGFSLGTDTAGNNSGTTYVAWQWQAGSSTVTNTSGTISAQVRANATTGFSIITYTGNSTAGATIGHGLGVAPNMIIVKPRNAADNWAVYHSSTGATQYLQLNTANASASSITLWNNTSPTSTVFSVGTNNDVNDSARNYVAYCWAEIAGFSKFGSYTGNGSTDGAFVYTGFKPKYLMVKCSSNGTTNWVIVDTSRNTYNVTNLSLEANNADAEQTGTSSTMPTMDVLSNGFKLRTTSVGGNGSGYTYIYMAFAENPFKNANAR